MSHHRKCSVHILYPCECSQLPPLEFTHICELRPRRGNDYQYNVPVFANDSLTSGTHTMTVQPVVPADTERLNLNIV
ncbi:hypothetical protein JVT61DRAFT_8934 [Boletus reticuloceps]|uniref:Uncharacterized protein n=1 Tax=Boletus reticuloceps TaxID=495285 RepID=A0A8I2YHC5_9AGAM|nr:hypothetical protein JVT61DRAFT_8934 [Boletus reticuloceps]